MRLNTIALLRRLAVACAFALLGLLVMLGGGMTNSPSTQAEVGPGGAQALGPGSHHTQGWVRVLDGRTIETYIEGQQVLVGLVGVTTPQGNTTCGKEATAALRELVKGGLQLDDEPGQTYDALERRLFHATTPDGRLVSAELVRAGIAHSTPNSRSAAAEGAEADAQANGRGCVWRKGGSAPQMGSPAVPTEQPSGLNFFQLGKLDFSLQPPVVDAAPAGAPLATTFPTHFTQQVIASGLDEPTSAIYLPDGRMLVSEKSGVIKLVKNGIVQVAPFLDIHSRVNDFSDRGLLSIAADPNFLSNGFIYANYVYENDAVHYDSTKTSRLVRFTAQGDTADPASELVLLGSLVGASCNAFPAGADCLPADSPSHSAGQIKFAPDGTLFLTNGDGASYNLVNDNALRAQNLDLLAGKVLHVTTSGSGVPGNPFWTGDPSANRSKVWAYGVRNSFRFNLRPGTSIPFLGDVGWNTWEEVDVANPGANLGWPCYEGNARQAGYAPGTLCQALYATGKAQPPQIAFSHGGVSSAVIGGTFYTGSTYPASYAGTYFFGNYAQSTFQTASFDGQNTLASGPTPFSTGSDAPVDLEMGPDGNLYYVSFRGEVLRIRYVPGTTPPTAVAAASPTTGLSPLNVTFSSAGSVDPDGGALTYSWNFGDASPPATTANPAHTYANNGLYTSTLTVADNAGVTGSATISIRVGDAPPVPSISSPTASLKYKVGDTITYSGSATDLEDGTIPPSGLAWQIILHHCPGGNCHTHPWINATGVASGSYTAPDHGDDSYFEIVLTATDSQGVSASTSVNIYPQTVQVSLLASTPGLQLVYGGTPVVSPFVMQAAVGGTRTVFAPSPQAGKAFVSWSDGGAAQHNVTIGASNVAFTATYASSVLGDTNVEAAMDSSAVGQAVAFPFVASGTDVVDTLYVYVDPATTATGLTAGVYANTGSGPGNLLAQGVLTSPIGGTWNAVSVPSTVLINGGHYWIAVLAPAAGGGLEFRDAGTGGLAQTSSQTTLQTLPTTWSVGASTSASAISAFAVHVNPSSDTQPPRSRMTAPQNGTTVSGTSVTLKADALDNVAVAAVQFLVDGAPVGPTLTSAPYTMIWDSSSVPTGTHKVSAVAVDTAGNSATSTAISVNVSNAVAPTPTFTTTPTSTPTLTPTATPTATGTPWTPTATSTPTSTATATATPSQPAVVLVGNSTILPGVSSNPTGSAEAFPYTAGATGMLNQLSILLDSSNRANQVVVGVYDNLPSQSPGNLLTQGTIASAIAGWNTVSVPPVSVSRSTRYWIAVLSPAGGGSIQFVSVSAGSQSQISKQLNLQALPATWSRGAYASNSPMSAYGSQAP